MSTIHDERSDIDSDETADEYSEEEFLTEEDDIEQEEW